MHRLAVVSSSLLLAVGVAAAPAPEVRPWVHGWDRPVNRRGDCRFHRDGEKLSIVVPGEGHSFQPSDREPNAPCLLRDVEGDFVVQVRVDGDFRPTGGDTFRRAGLLLTDGKVYLLVERANDPAEGFWIGFGFAEEPPPVLDQSFGGPGGKGPAFLRMERRGDDKFQLKVSIDGKKWNRFVSEGVPMARKLKVGVIAEATAPGEFKPVFDSFRISRGEPSGEPSVPVPEGRPRGSPSARRW
jgi:hypothetical protein